MKEQDETSQVVGLLVLDYGTPLREEDIMPYYTHIRRGYPPTTAEVERLKKRYRAIGGTSPLAALTAEQAQALVDALNASATTVRYRLFTGHKHCAPFIEDAVTEMAEAGITEAATIVMAPYFSLFSTAAYFERARRRAARYGLTLHEVQAWNEEPEFIRYWTNALEKTLSTTGRDASVAVIFTAHSLPYHVIHMGDSYPACIEATAKRVAEAVGLTSYHMAWQSAGVRGDWLTPDVATVTKEVADDQAVRTVVYVPIGFVCDHLEVLYDNDIECKALCDTLNLAYTRVDMPNTNATFIEAMHRAVLRTGIEQQR